MDKDLTYLAIVVDRSGSMEAMRSDAEGGVNNLLKEQAREKGKCLVSLTQFDTEIDMIQDGTPINDVPRYELRPRGATGLLDAVGQTIVKVGERLEAMKEEDRPGLVVFVIATDGYENSSKEYDRKRIREMIEAQEKDYSWQFTFLGANIDAFAEAGSMGIDLKATANYSANTVTQAYAATSAKMSRMRSATAASLAVDNSFTEEERESMEDKGG